MLFCRNRPDGIRDRWTDLRTYMVHGTAIPVYLKSDTNFGIHWDSHKFIGDDSHKKWDVNSTTIRNVSTGMKRPARVRGKWLKLVIFIPNFSYILERLMKCMSYVDKAKSIF